MKIKLLIIELLVICALGTPVFAQSSDHDQWKKGRYAELLAEDGWVNLVNLIWLDSGLNHFHFAKKDSLAISTSERKKELGIFKVDKEDVKFYASKKSTVLFENGKISEFIQFPIENGKSGSLNSGRWQWAVIKRGDRFAIRLRDLEHPALADFKPIPTFEYDPNWRLDAFFEPRFNQFISITNVLGQVIEWRVMGILKFEIQGEKQEVIALEDEKKLFLIFSDQTNGTSSYPSGRYLYVAYPDKSGNTTIDFNYAYNPPCAFTAFATCPIPPKENRLGFAIEAGEKYLEGKY